MKTSSLNLCLIAIGIFFVCLGVFRSSSIKFERAFLLNNIPMAIAMIGVLALAFRVGGMQAMAVGTDATVRTTSSFLPLLLMLMPVIGFSAPIAIHYQDRIGALLSGHFGFPMALTFAGISPTSAAFNGLVSKLWKVKELHMVILYFMSAIPLISMSILFIRTIGLNPEIRMAIYKTNFSIAFCLMPVFWMISKIINR